MYIVLLVIIYIAFISLGLPDSLLGAAWPVIRTDFVVPLSYMGIISMIISGGTIISGLLSYQFKIDACLYCSFLYFVTCDDKPVRKLCE